MQVTALDHINISTTNIETSARFYAELLDLDIRNIPAPVSPDYARWLYDHAGNPIIHLVKRDPTAESTGPIHHVALNCIGKEELIARLRERGAEFSVHDNTSINLTQIFTRDPHGILLELNFRTV